MRRLYVALAKLFFITLGLGLFIALPVDGQCPNIPPVAIFNYLPPFPYVNEAIVFDASESYDPNGFIWSYTWDFGDGNITTIVSTPDTIAHLYVNPGEYNVTLTVMDNLQATNSTAKIVPVRRSVLASFSYSPLEPHVHESITFDASNSTVSTGTIASYAWDFGDGNESLIATPFIAHSYAAAKAYVVTLNVSGSNGGWDIASQVVNVTAVAPKALFTWLPEVPEAGQTVEFNASDSTADGGEIASYSWNFGDGGNDTVTQPFVTHVFTNFGNYIVILNVTNGDGFSDAVNHTLTVIERPVANFSFTPDRPRVCSHVTFNASISDPRGGLIVSFEWNFGDNSSVESGVTVTHRFKKMGDHKVTLNVTDSENLWNVMNITIKILPHIADLNEDGVVNILDIVIFAKAYRSVPGQERWNERADIDGNGIVNIIDGVVIARSYNMCIDPLDP